MIHFGNVARLTKALRGKHRWIGITINDVKERNDFESEISKILVDINFKLFDCERSDSLTKGIIKVSIDDYHSARDLIALNSKYKSISSSGKIKLVRMRIGLKKPTRKR
tara:strand:+ start:774 stop:1100 length:327 start_codon:yes stop_codon:yes gene_type:complete